MYHNVTVDIYDADLIVPGGKVYKLPVDDLSLKRGKVNFAFLYDDSQHLVGIGWSRNMTTLKSVIGGDSNGGDSSGGGGGDSGGDDGGPEGGVGA